MKTNYTTLLVLFITLGLVVPFSSCDKTDDDVLLLNDTIYVIDSTNLLLLDNLSAVWTLESGYSEIFKSEKKEFRWLDDECEDAFDGNANPLPQELDEQTILSKTFNYEDALATYNQILTTDRANIIDTIYNLPVDDNEFEDAYSKNNVQINFKYDLTLKRNGEYKVYLMYNYFDEDVPIFSNENSEMQYGKTYSGTYEYVGNWQWVENSIGLPYGININGFPLPVVSVFPIYDFSGIELLFSFNYVSGIGFALKDRFFQIENLTSTELIINGFDNENYYTQNNDVEFEAYLSNGTQIDCEGVFTETRVLNENLYFKFISDGIDVED